MRLLIKLMAIVCSLVGLQAQAQDFSNKGREFWIAYPTHIDGTQSAMGIYITSDVNATGTILVGTQSIPFTVQANNVVRKFIGPNAGGDAPNTAVHLNQNDGVTTAAGIKVTSDVPVAVYAHIIRSARSGATLVLPITVWGREYIVPGKQSTSNGNSLSVGEIAVMASEPNTTIEITPSVVSRNLNRQPGVPFTVTLANPGDVYQLQFQDRQDISGTVVRSIASGGTGCKPIAVFSATTWSAFDCGTGASGGDNLYQQIFPTSAWGRRYLTAPMINRNSDIIRVFARQANTVVSITQGGVTTNNTIATAGGFYEIATNQPLSIEANNPVSVVQYITSQSCKTGCGTGGNVPSTCHADPEMIVLNPVEQTINNITVFSAHQNFVPQGQSAVTSCFLNIIIKTNAAASFRINNAPPSGNFVQIPGTQYSYLQENVSTISTTNPVQTLRADSAFSAIAYGYGNVESYGYNAGTNVKDLYQFITLQNNFATVNFPATCVSTPLRLAITLPYQPTSLQWDFNNNPNQSPNGNITINNPVADSTFVVDGRTLYQYRLPANYSFTAVGTFPIKVIANNPTSDGCSGLQEITYQVQVFDKPTVNFDWVHSGCLNDTVRLQDRSNTNGRSVINYRWTLGDGTIDSIARPNKLYTTAGIYPINLRIVTDVGCVSDSTKNITISNVPIANFGVSDTLCVNKTITLTDSSSVIGGTIVRWFWDYGNGRRDTLTAAVPRTIHYSDTGTYTIRLITESNSGCFSNAFTRTIRVRSNPVASFSLPIVCLPIGRAAFVNQTTIADTTLAGNMRYRWLFGDGGADTVTNPIHNYSVLGPFTVRLTAISAFGCIDDSVQVLNSVFPQPRAGFTVNVESCQRDSVTFTDTSNGLGSTVTRWRWIYGDGRTDTIQNPRHQFLFVDTFSVRLVVITNQGCISDTAVRTHIVHPLPRTGFSTSQPLCERQGIQFTDTSSALGAGTLVQWHWQMADGTNYTFTNASSFVHVYDTAGLKSIRLTVRSSKGCQSDTLEQQTLVHPTPRTNFGLPEVCLSDAFAEFSDSTRFAGSGGLRYHWTFGDPNATPTNPDTSIVQNPRHRYSQARQYTVQLITTATTGCADTLAQSFTVNGARPEANFSVLDSARLCSNERVVIRNTSTVDFGVVTRVDIIWDLVNAPTVVQTDNTPQPNGTYSHAYPVFHTQTPRNYTIRLLAYSGGSCVDIKDTTITLLPAPRVVFNTMPGICLSTPNRTITQASDSANLPGTFAFSGSGVTSAGVFTPNVSGTFPIQYLVVSNSGCRDSVTRNLTVWPRPIAVWGTSSPLCENNVVRFLDTSRALVGNIVQWQWNFGDGRRDTFTNGNAFNRTYASFNTYNASLTVVTDSGCISTAASRTLVVQPLPRVSFTIPAVVCLPNGDASFTNSTTIPDGTGATLQYLWTFGDAANPTPSVQINPTHRYTTLGSKTVRLVVTSVNGCVDSSTQVFSNIFPQPRAGFTASTNFVCVGDAINFNDTSNGLTSAVTNWRWFFGDGGTSTIQNPTYTFNNVGAFTVRQVITNNQGCISDTANLAVNVYAYPTVNAGPDLNVLEGGNSLINATASGNNLRFRWTPNRWLNSDTILRPITAPQGDITYTLTVTGQGNCSVTDNMFVKLLLAPEIPTAFSPNGDGINDTWIIKYLESYPGCTVEVFNRYGQSVFSSRGYATPWNGTYNGAVLPVGTYYYIVDPKNGRNKIAGYVTILR
ncbi:MAG TPA: hypothetical protein DCQ29_05840 [Chitinophagaceae bacterium]|nr:hypothetical protein [Chitinophagaceae bacterium]